MASPDSTAAPIPLKTFTPDHPHKPTDLSDSRLLHNIDEEDEAENEKQKILEGPQQFGSIAERLEHLFFHHDEIFSFSSCTKSKIMDYAISAMCLCILIIVLVSFSIFTRAPDEYNFNDTMIFNANLMPNLGFKKLKREVIALCGTIEKSAAQNKDTICFNDGRNCTSLSQLFLKQLHHCQIETDRRTQLYDSLFPNFERNIIIGRVVTIILVIIILGLCILIYQTHGQGDIFRRPSKRVHNLPRSKLERGCFVFIIAFFAMFTIVVFLALSLYIPKECYSLTLETCKNKYPGYNG